MMDTSQECLRSSGASLAMELSKLLYSISTLHNDGQFFREHSEEYMSTAGQTLSVVPLAHIITLIQISQSFTMIYR